MNFKEEQKEKVEKIEAILIPSVWWRDRSDLSVYGSNGDDPYLFTGS